MASLSNKDSTTPVTTGADEVNIKQASTNKRRHIHWSTASVVFMLTCAVFMADFVFLGQSGGAQTSWLGNIDQFFTFSNNFTLDCTISGSLISLIVFQLGYRRIWGSSGETNKATRATNSANVGKVMHHGPRLLRFGCPAPGGGSSTGVASGSSAPSGAGGSLTMLPERPVSRWNQAIDIAARSGDSKKAGRLLLEFEQSSDSKPGNCPDDVSYNLVIRSCAKRGDFRGAEEWLFHMQSKGVEATVCSYNTVLDACAKADNAEKCEAWLEKMLQKGIETNVISYATTIYAWARRGEEARAEHWHRKMMAAGVTPDAVSYNSLIHACGVAGNAAGAERWLEKMQAAGLEATVTSFTSVMDAAAKAGDIPRAEKWLEAMIVAKVEPNVVSFVAVIDACAKASDTVRAEYWHGRMIECGVEPNAYSYSAVINACSKAGDVVRAEAWLERSENSGITNDVVAYSTVIDACSKAGDAERAMAIFKKIQAKGLRPHIVAYAALARPFAYRGDWEQVESIAEDMATNGVSTNEYFLYAQLLSYATARPRQAARAEQCFRKALHSGLKANDHVVGALCRNLGRERTVELMDELCNGRSVPLPGNGRSLPKGGSWVPQGSRRQ